MAIYEYRCPNCKKEFEVMRPMKEADRPARCPRCQSRGTRLVSVFGSTPAVGSGIKVPDKGAFRQGPG